MLKFAKITFSFIINLYYRQIAAEKPLICEGQKIVKIQKKNSQIK